MHECKDCSADHVEDLLAMTLDRDALLTACKKLEAAELANANCEECNGEGVPELCEVCFPLFDDARLARREAIAGER